MKLTTEEVFQLLISALKTEVALNIHDISFTFASKSYHPHIRVSRVCHHIKENRSAGTNEV